jgi:UDP-N-acetylglucosamine/UDP-N-acetylgalactosamine diphosphorylase
MSATKDELLRRLRSFGQEHLLAFWDQLNPAERDGLEQQLAAVDFDRLSRLATGRDASPDWGELAARALPPRAIRLGDTHNEFHPDEARARGEELLRKAAVGMILVAGGQGTRLGFPHPKGLLPLGPLSKRTLFEILFDRLRAVALRYAAPIPLYIMTSPATHAETLQFLTANGRFGLAEDELRLFCQGVMPAVDAASGKVLLADRAQLALNPDGHGGMLGALARSGCLADAQRRGVQHFFYGQIDNPLLQVCDPLLLGYHLLAGSEMTSQVVAKQDPLDRVGNVAIIDGRTQVIEYSDLPESAARRRTSDGYLYFWAGSIAVHVFAVEFLARMEQQQQQLPFHRALKKSPCVDSAGNRVEPAAANSIKFERFIFDLLPAAQNPIVVEGDAAEVFAPVKNAAGAARETVATSQAAMMARDRVLLRAGGVVVADDVAVEVNPRWALDAADVTRRLAPGTRITTPTYFV